MGPFDEENKKNEKYNVPVIVKYVGLISLKLNKICQYAANKLKKIVCELP